MPETVRMHISMPDSYKRMFDSVVAFHGIRHSEWIRQQVKKEYEALVEKCAIMEGDSHE